MVRRNAGERDNFRSWLSRLLLPALLVGLALLAVGPSLLPSSYLSSQVAAALQESLGRPVEVSGTHLSWFHGLRVEQIRVRDGMGREAMQIDHLELNYQPWELPSALLSKPGSLGRARIGRLALRVVRSADGRLNLPESRPDGAAPDFKSIEVLDGQVDLHDEALGTHRQISNLKLSLGRLEGGQKAYLTGSGSVPEPGAGPIEPSGRVSFSGLLDRFDLRSPGTIIGGCDVQWDEVNFGSLLPPMGPKESPLQVLAPSNGNASLTVGGDQLIRFQGSISADQLLVRQGMKPDLAAEQTTLSLVGSYDRSRHLLRIEPLQLSGGGSAMRMSGHVEVTPKGLYNGQLQCSGLISWSPLKQMVPALGRVLAPFQTAAGTANVRQMDVEIIDSVARIKGLIDLGRTELILEPLLRKQSDRAAVLVVDFTIDLRTLGLSIHGISLMLSPPNVPAEGLAVPPGSINLHLRTEQRPAPGTADDLQQALVLEVLVPDVTALPRHLPSSEALLRQLQAYGSLQVTAEVFPGLPGLPAQLVVEAGELGFQTGPQTSKASGQPLRLAMAGLLQGSGGQLELQSLLLQMSPAELRWQGRVAAVRRLQGAPADDRLEFDGRLDLVGAEHWQQLLRPLLPEKPGIALAGNLSSHLQGSIGEESLQLAALLELARAAVEVTADVDRPPLFLKPLGRPLEISVNLNMGRDLSWLRLKQKASFGRNQFDLELDESRGTELALPPNVRLLPFGSWSPLQDQLARELATRALGGTSVKAALTAPDVDELLSLFPPLHQYLAAYEPGGMLRVELNGYSGQSGPQRLNLAGMVDATDLTYRVGEEIRKSAGLTQRVEFAVHLPPVDESGLEVIELDRLEARLGPSRVTVSGSVSFDADVRRVATRLPTLVLNVHQLRGSGRVELVQHNDLRKFSRWWDTFSRGHDLRGRAELGVAVEGNRRGGSMTLTADATQAAFRYGYETEKPAGVEASCFVQAESGGLAGAFDIHDAYFALGETFVTCSGTVYSHRRLPLSLADLAGLSLHLEAQSRTLANLAELVPLPQLRRLRPSGGMTMAVDVAADSYGLQIDSGDFLFSDMSVQYEGTPLTINGAVSLSQSRLRADALRISAGQSMILLAADIASPLAAPNGSLAVTGNYFNLERLLKALGVAQPADQLATESAAAEGIPADWPRMQRFLSRCDINGTLAIDRFIWQDDFGVTYDWQAFSSQFDLRNAALDVRDFKAVWRSGVVTGAVGIDFRPANPEIYTRYAIRNIEAGPEIQPLINNQFPDMIVRGRINQVYDARQKLFTLPGEPNFPQGATLFEAFDGTMSGKATPKWLSDLIPGLSTASYDFTRMRNIGRLTAEGRAENQMLFEGANYSLYIDGSTSADGTAAYVLGVDLMNSLDRTTAVQALEQGRIPLMEFNGRIVDSAWQGLEVRFKLPHEVAYDVLLRRNLLVRLLDRRGVAERPDFSPYRFAEDGPP